MGICCECKEEFDKLVVYCQQNWCRRCRNKFILRRLGAFLLDMVFVWVGTFVAIFILGLFLYFVAPALVSDKVLFQRLGWLIGLPFFLCRDGIAGRSVGKRMLGLQVIDLKSGTAADMTQSFLRNLPIYIPFLAIIAAFTLRNEARLGEGWAGTGVVRYDPSRPVRPVKPVDPVDPEPPEAVPSDSESTPLPETPKRPCPFCGQMVEASTNRCPHCKFFVNNQ